MLKKPDLLPHIHLSPKVDLPRSRLRSPLGMALVAAPMLAVMAAFAISPQSYAPAPERMQEQALRLQPVLAAAGAVFNRSERISRGDTAAMVLTRLAIRDDAASEFLRQDALAASLTRLQPGAMLHARVDDTGALHELRFRSGKDKEILIQRDGQGFSAQERDLPLHVQLESRSGTVNGSLFTALDNAGIPDEYARQLIEIFSGDIDFHRGLKRGDRFSMVYEVLVDDYGSQVRPGRLLAANFVNGGEEHAAIGFTLSDGRNEFFSPDGQSLKRAFLQNPVEFSRVSSGFSHARMHPVLQTMRAHKGVDYAAPTGSKVMATADGVIDYIGVKGGFGNVITIRHDGRYSTVYGHLNGFAQGLRQGARVEQGQVIGYVGQTGLASGPHLHYEFLVNGVQIDPLSARVPVATALDKQQLQAFREQAQRLQQDLALQQVAMTGERFE